MVKFRPGKHIFTFLLNSRALSKNNDFFFIFFEKKVEIDDRNWTIQNIHACHFFNVTRVESTQWTHLKNAVINVDVAASVKDPKISTSLKICYSDYACTPFLVSGPSWVSRKFLLHFMES